MIYLRYEGVQICSPKSDMLTEGSSAIKLHALFRVATILSIFGFTSTAWCQQWMEYRSENVIVYTDRKPGQVQGLIEEFERFRQMAVSLMEVKPAPHDEMARIYAFANEPDFRKFVSGERVAGFYQDSSTGPRIAMGPDARLVGTDALLLHDYVHHLLRQKRADQMPLWYDEGWAELLASAQLDANAVVIGGAHPSLLTLLPAKYLPLQQLLRPDMGRTDPEYWDAYRATSWLFVHFLNLGQQSGEKAYLEETGRYLALWRVGLDPLEAFERAFGMHPRAMDGKLGAYLDTQKWTPIRMGNDLPDLAIKSRPLAKNETAYTLGELAYLTAQKSLARDYLKQVEADKDSVASALALRAVIASQEGQQPLAHHYLKTALSKGADEAVVFRNAAQVLWNALIALPAEDQNSANRLALQIQELAQRALALDARDLDAMRFRWRAELQLGEVLKATDTMLLAYRTRPTDVGLNFEIGNYFVTAEPPRAEKFLRRVLQWEHIGRRRQQAYALLQTVEMKNAATAAGQPEKTQARETEQMPSVELGSH